MNGNNSRFIHLHVHSEYSLYNSTLHLNRYVEEAKHRGLKHLAVADNGNLFAAAEFYRLCQEAGINPIIGCRFSMSSGLGTILLIAENNQGYHNLMQLSTHYNLQEKEPVLTDDLLRKYHHGLIALSGGMEGEVSQLLQEVRYIEAERRVLELQEIFGMDSFFLEIQDHGSGEHKKVNEVLNDLSRKLGIPLVATNEVHYLHEDEAPAYHVLREIGTLRGRYMDTFFEEQSDHLYLKSEDEMCALFSDIPDAIENTACIAQRCKIDLRVNAPDLPKAAVPDRYISSFEYLKDLVTEGLSHRYNPVPQEVLERAEHELVAIKAIGYVDFFLIVADFVANARSRDIPVGPGWGSAAGLLINYALGITDVDPVKYGLLSERFLNPERIATPDIKIDFCYERRGEVIRYVQDIYGADRTANIITFGRYQARIAVRDVGRAMGLPYSQIDSFAKSIPIRPGMNLKYAKEEVEALKDAVSENTVFGKVLNIAQVLEGLPKNISTHAVGIALSREAIASYTPLYKIQDSSVICTQYTVARLAELGPVKFDFLGFKVLTLLHHCQNRIRVKNPEFRLSQIPDDDEPAFRLLGAGSTTGVFQCESTGMKDILKEAKPQSIEELAVLNALYRPGAMEIMPRYIEAKNKGRCYQYPPEISDILAPTYGIVIYQEQIMEIAHVVSGWSYGKGDILRRTLAKSDAKGGRILRSSFTDDAIRNGYSEKKAEEILELMVNSAPCLALKAHSICYALLAYRSAYLKANYPQEYMESYLYLERDNPSRHEAYLEEAAEMDIT